MKHNNYKGFKLQNTQVFNKIFQQRGFNGKYQNIVLDWKNIVSTLSNDSELFQKYTFPIQINWKDNNASLVVGYSPTSLSSIIVFHKEELIARINDMYRQNFVNDITFKYVSN